VQVVYGDRDETVNWKPVVARTREQSHTVESVPADHRFAGQTDRVADAVASFLSAHVSDL